MNVNKMRREQEFAANWRRYHERGMHKPVPVIYPCIYPKNHPRYVEPIPVMESPLKLVHHVLYNYLRGLPLLRAVKIKDGTIDKLVSQLWYVSVPYNSPTAVRPQLTEIFGEGLTADMLKEFYKLVLAIKY